jgi:hypothetical protein
LKLEKILAKLVADNVPEDPDECLEDKAMKMAAEEIYEQNGRKWKPWACNGKSLRVGEIILIIDADTIVPEVRYLPFVSTCLRPTLCILQDCFRDAAREMGESPDLAIIQHESGRSPP